MKYLKIGLWSAALFMILSAESQACTQEKEADQPSAASVLWQQSLMPLAYLDRIVELYTQNDVQNILSLSIGGDRSPLGVAKNLPHVNVTATDIADLSVEGSPANYSFVQQDNRKKFAFEDNSFQVITMRCGLCVCTKPAWWEYPKTCAGLKVKQSSLVSFFSEIFRVLDSENENSFASLEGCANDLYSEIFEKSITRVLARQNDWSAEIMRDSQGKFEGVFFAKKQDFYEMSIYR